jgi:hypothetical protein
MSNSPRGSSFGFVTILSALAYFLFVLALVAAGGVFLYGNILASQKTSKDAALASAESSIDQGTISDLVRLRDRLSSAQTLLNNHIALSGLFNLLETVTPSDADFSSVNVTIDDSGNALLVADGTAKSFNALAAASDDFSTASGLKNAIFSNLAVASNGSVSFVLSATLEPSLIAYTGSTGSPQAGAEAAPAPAATASTTAATATTTP